MGAETRKMILDLVAEYPLCQVEDVYKFLHQSSMGCGHMISDETRARDFIESEHSSASDSQWPLVQHLDGPYVRIGLGILDKGLKASTLAHMMLLSCDIPEDGKANLEEKLSILVDMAKGGEVPFDAGETVAFVQRLKDAGFPAIHHSDAFREAYKPAYRVVHERFGLLLDDYCEKDKASRR